MARSDLIISHFFPAMKERGNNFLKHIDRYFGIPVLACLCIPSLLRKQRHVEVHDVSGRIGIFCPGAIGDLLLASALLDGIHGKIPDATIELVATPSNAAAIPLIPHLDYYKVFPVAKPASIVKYVRTRQYDLFIDLSQWSRLGALVTALSGARLKVGFRTPGQFRHYPYDIIVEHSSQRHELENFLALGQAIWTNFKGSPMLNLPKPASAMENVLCCHMWPAPGKNSSLKEWPESSWAELIGVLKNKYRILLTGSHADYDANRRFIERNFSLAENVEALYPASLMQLASIFHGVRAVISVNTGIMHLAALTGVPTVGLHGPTNPDRWGPRGKNVIALQPDKGKFGYLNLGFEYPPHPEQCMQFLPVGKVLDSLRKLGLEIFN